MAHDVRRLDCVPIDLVVANQPGLNPPTLTNRQGWRVYSYSNVVEESLLFLFRIPQAYIPGDGVQI